MQQMRVCMEQSDLLSPRSWPWPPSRFVVVATSKSANFSHICVSCQSVSWVAINFNETVWLTCMMEESSRVNMTSMARWSTIWAMTAQFGWVDSVYCFSKAISKPSYLEWLLSGMDELRKLAICLVGWVLMTCMIEMWCMVWHSSQCCNAWVP